MTAIMGMKHVGTDIDQDTAVSSPAFTSFEVQNPDNYAKSEIIDGRGPARQSVHQTSRAKRTISACNVGGGASRAPEQWQ